MSTGFDRVGGDGLRRGERALVVLPDRSNETNSRTTEARLDEAAGLAEAGTRLAQRENPASGPPSPRSGEGPRVRIRRAGHPQGV